MLDKSLKSLVIRAALLVALTVTAFAPALTAGFIWDDDDHVTQNETLVDGAGLRRIWIERGAVPQYYPLVHTTFWVERQLWDLNASGYHAANIALHALAAILFWRVLVRLRVPGSMLAALIFAVHPVAVESVAWITERKNVLSAVFYFASALAWLRMETFAEPAGNARNPGSASSKRPVKPNAKAGADSRRAWYVTSLVLFVCALLSKTVTASLPAALLLICWWKNGRVRWSEVRPLIPFFVIGLALATNTAWMERARVGAVGEEWSFSIAERVLIAGRAVWFYAWKLFVPTNLTFIYPRWEVDASSLRQWLFPITAVATVAVAWLMRARVGRGPLVALLFFGGTLVPALGLTNVYPMRFSFVADHFQYLASAGVITLVCATLTRHKLAERAAFALPVLFAVLTWRQTLMYHDLETLWSTTLARNPAAWLAHNNLGNIFLQRGEMDSAVVRFRDAVRLKPDYYEAHGNLATSLLRLGAVEEARASTDAALRASPNHIPALLNRASIMVRDGQYLDAIRILQDVLRQEPENAEALNTLGAVFASGGDFNNARAAFEAALRFKPELVLARVNLARVLARLGHVDAASSQVDQVLQQAPGNSDARNTRGLILMARGQNAEAVAHFRGIIREAPSDASAHFFLATLLSQEGKSAEAIEEFQTTIRLNPLHAEARNNLGIAYLIAERYADAAEQFAEALGLRRSNPEAHNNLAYALIRLHRVDEAVVHLTEALRLRPEYPEAAAQLKALRR